VIDRREFLGTGWRFPVRVGAEGGLGWAAAEQSVGEGIWLVLSTAPGERQMRPDFGCGIHDLVFAGDDANTHAAVAHNVRHALTTWEPRIDVLDVEVETSGDLRNVLLISVDYRIRSNNAMANLVYPFYITEGLRGA
jgi:phage baseplate assembly protein W